MLEMVNFVLIVFVDLLTWLSFLMGGKVSVGKEGAALKGSEVRLVKLGVGVSSHKTKLLTLHTLLSFNLLLLLQLILLILLLLQALEHSIKSLNKASPNLRYISLGSRGGIWLRGTRKGLVEQVVLFVLATDVLL